MNDLRQNPQRTPAGGFPANPLEKPGHQLEFSEEFDGTELDLQKWLPFYLPQWSSRELAAARYSLTGHSLLLHIDQDQQPWNPDFDGALRVSSLQTGCHAGPVGSEIGQHRFKPGLKVREAQPTQHLYTPLYGWFEIRMRALPAPGYMAALWMIGFEEDPSQSGEICICELFGKGMTEATAEVGYGVHPFGDPHLKEEFYMDTFPINAADFHVYAVDWTPGGVDFYIDNIKVRSTGQSPSYPMQFMLNIYELPGQLTPASDTLPWPRTAEVDYVRGYRAARHLP